MNSITFIRAELLAAISRGVSQCVLIGSRPLLPEAFDSSTQEGLQVFALAEEQPSDSLATALASTAFDKRKPSLFVWLGGAGYRTVEAAVSSLAFIASLPGGSGVVFDYATKRTSISSLTHTALDALASRIGIAGGSIIHLIQPQAVAEMLRCLGFQNITDLAQDEPQLSDQHLVSALI